MAFQTLRASLRSACANTHVCTECWALSFLLLAVGAAALGLHIAPVVLSLFAIVLASTDAYEWWHERR